MTLSERNIFFKIGMIFCAVAVLIVIAASVIIIQVYPSMEENVRQPQSFIQFITKWFLNTDYLAVHASIVLAVIYSLVTIIIIHFYFERTAVQEIIYISFFTISLSFEAIRLIIPLHFYNTLPVFYLMTAARVLFFVRYFSLFSLFTASVCAAGLEVQRTRDILIILIIASFIISIGIPIDTLSYDTCFNFITGFSFMFTMIRVFVLLAVFISFCVAVKSRSSKEYLLVGIGVVIAIAGKSVLLNTDNWAGPIAGILLLSFGTWLMCSKLHKIHLWL